MGNTTRREFFKRSALLVGTGAPLLAGGISGCGSSSSSFSGAFTGDGGDLGHGDTAIVNTFYAYKQLTTSFLAYVVSGGGGALAAQEFETVTQIYDHEIAHLNFLRGYLGINAIPELSGFDFTSVPLSDRQRILDRIRQFEDVGVQGWNGSPRYFSDAQNIRQLQRMASVDARHSAAIRELIDPGADYFAGGDEVGSKTGLERLANPYFVLSVVRSYDPTPFLNSGDLP